MATTLKSITCSFNFEVIYFYYWKIDVWNIFQIKTLFCVYVPVQKPHPLPNGELPNCNYHGRDWIRQKYPSASSMWKVFNVLPSQNMSDKICTFNSYIKLIY